MNLKALLKKHREEIADLRAECRHDERHVKIRLDTSVVGCGSAYPSVNVVCKNCGRKKIIFDLDKETRKTVKRTLERQGFKDERDSVIQYEYELD